MGLALDVVTYNTHLFGSTMLGGLYARDALRAGLVVDLLRTLEVDVVALTEVWDIACARRIVDGLSERYPHVAYGPFRGGLRGRIGRLASYSILAGPLAGGLRVALPFAAAMLGYAAAFGDRRFIGSGLLLLSRWPLGARASFRPFATAEPLRAADRFAQKGVLVVEISPEPERFIDVLLTHLQAGATPQARATRAGQLAEIATLSGWLRTIHPERPQLIVGDYNVVGEAIDGPGEEYEAMLGALPGFVDSYRRLEPRAAGWTFDSHRNALAARFGTQPERARLDYILASAPVAVVRAGVRDDLDPLGEVSDHYALEASLRW